MATVRELKKDIRFLTEQLLVDTLEVSEVVNEKDKQQILDLVIEISKFHNELIGRVNHPDGKENPKLVKSYFGKISSDLLTGSNDFYAKIGKLIPE
jgi:hypothetical protein